MKRDDINEVLSPLPASPSFWPMIDLESLRNSRMHAEEDIPSRQGDPKTKVVKRPQTVLACLNCRPKKVKCRIEGHNSACIRCLRLDIQCFMPIEDERRLPCSKKVIRELQNKVKLLEEALREAQVALEHQSYVQHQAQNSQPPSGGHWIADKEIPMPLGTNVGPYFVEEVAEQTPADAVMGYEDDRRRLRRINQMMETGHSREVFLAEDFLYESTGTAQYDILQGQHCLQNEVH